MMRTCGVKVLDKVFHTSQVDWLVVHVEECRDELAEQQLIAAHFRVPHPPWGSDRAFVAPVEIRRSRRRVLFRQKSGEAFDS
jgi:hypothetical protein